MSELIPPKKRDWKPGALQVGVFVRTPDGSVCEYVNDDVNTDGKRAELLSWISALVEPTERPRPVSRAVIDGVQFHVCDGTAFRNAPSELVNGKSADMKMWDSRAIFGQGFPFLELDTPGNTRRHHIVVEVYEGEPAEPEQGEG